MAADRGQIFAMMSLLVSMLILLTPSSGSPKTIGPDYVARAKLLRDLPLARALSGAMKVAPKTRNRTLIDMSLSVRSLDLSYADGEFRLNGFMKLSWNDPRYAWNSEDYGGIASVPLPFSSAWAPDVILHNALEEKFIFRQVGVVKANGDIVYLVAVHTKSSCRPKFEDPQFPFHIQTCSLKFGSWLNGQYQVDFRVTSSNNASSVNLGDYTSPTGWEILATEARLESVQYPLFEEPSHIVVYTFSFRRNVFYNPKSGLLFLREVVRRKDNASEIELSNRGDQQGGGHHSDF